MYYFDFNELDKTIPSRFAHMFEYLFFFIEEDILHTPKCYGEEYFRYLKKEYNLSPKIEKLKKTSGLQNYIFFNSNQINSPFMKKSTLLKFQLENKFFDHQVRFIKNVLDSNPENMIYKKDLGFSGRGVSESKKGAAIEEEKLNRLIDFSIFYNDGDLLIYQNFVDDNFQYKGTIIESEYIKSINDFLLRFVGNSTIEDFINKLTLTIDFCKKHTNHFCLDSFIYEKKGEKLIHPGCEVNDRKTMGYLFHEIKKNLFNLEERITFKISKNQLDGYKLLSPSNDSLLIQYSLEA